MYQIRISWYRFTSKDFQVTDGEKWLYSVNEHATPFSAHGFESGWSLSGKVVSLSIYLMVFLQLRRIIDNVLRMDLNLNKSIRIFLCILFGHIKHRNTNSSSSNDLSIATILQMRILVNTIKTHDIYFKHCNNHGSGYIHLYSL